MTSVEVPVEVSGEVSGQQELATDVWRRLRMLVLERYDRRAEVSAALDLSFIRIKALQQVAAAPLTMRELAERLNIDRPYSTVVVDDLEQRELVRRDLHPDDRRLKVVSITEAGVSVARRASGLLNHPPQSVVELAPADLATLSRILDALVPQ